MTQSSEAVAHSSLQLPLRSSSTPLNVLLAVVDEVPSPYPAWPPHSKAVSVLCGRLEEMLPDMWKPCSASPDSDTVGTIDFEVDGSRITLPLARTPFLNGKTSTLVAAQYKKTGDVLTVTKWLFKNRQRLLFPPSTGTDFKLWTPLVPITHSRVVTNSFGNIVKAVKVDDNTASVPASMELEKAVEVVASHRFPSGVPPESWGIWAMVTPNTSAREAPDLLPPFPLTEPISQHQLTTASRHLEQVCKSGGRLYRILSGGGGWGNKKGLLSLDPQQSHRGPDDEDEDDGGGKMLLDTGTFEIAPPGSRIQFFATASESSKPDPSRPQIFVVGVSDRAEAVKQKTDHVDGPGHHLSVGHFGALSNSGIFVDGCIKSKLDTPGSRLYVG
ncbi:hypothetical protein CP532_0977 [Ophiocordyceps camponoti-leonardi (nom. inval.)]|nr:hypothetical protein CP532_0977 [Ophiocordyceps camponoti-leonardi (nom. inval.)]